MILVDSSVWIDYFSGCDSAQVESLDRLLGTTPLAIGDLILTEVLQGFRRDRDFRTARKLMESLPIYDMLGKRVALKSAENYQALRKWGVTVRKTVDVIIASFCWGEL
jgi:predicted nucleic acid-binding protein